MMLCNSLDLGLFVCYLYFVAKKNLINFNAEPELVTKLEQLISLANSATGAQLNKSEMIRFILWRAVENSETVVHDLKIQNIVDTLQRLPGPPNAALIGELVTATFGSANPALVETIKSKVA